MNISRPCYLCTQNVRKPLQMSPICERCAKDLAMMDAENRMRFSLKIAKLRQVDDLAVSLKLIEGAIIKAIEISGRD